MPLPGTECISNSDAMRWIAPRPVPGLPAVEYPSRSARAGFANPGPQSSASSSMPLVAPRCTAPNISSPRPACFTTFVAVSVTTTASAPAAGSVNPSFSARRAAMRRASPTALRSSTASTVCTGVCMLFRSTPARDADARALSGPRVDFELVRQPFCAAQPESQAGARGIAVSQCNVDIRDAGALVDKCQAQTFPAAFVERLDDDFTPPAMEYRVAREFACGSNDLGLVNQGEAHTGGLLAHRLTHADDVLCNAQRQSERLGSLHDQKPERRAARPRARRLKPRPSRGPGVGSCLFRH